MAKARLLFLLLSFFAPAIAQPETPAAQQKEANAAELYREAFELLGHTSEDFFKRAAQAAGRYPADAPFWQNSPLGRMGRALEIMKAAGAAAPIDWGVNWEEAGYDGINEIPQILPQLSRLAAIYHETLLDLGQPDRIASDVAALMTASRHFADQNLLIHYRNSLAVETTVLEFLAKNAARLPESVLEELAAALRDLPPLPTVRDVVDWEEAALRGQLWNLLAGVGKAANTDTLLPTNDDLRVSSIVAVGREDITIGFEMAGGGSFTLGPGQKRRGYELLKVDLDEGLAILRKGKEVMVVELAARKIHPIEVETGWQRVEKHLQGSGLWDATINRIVANARADKAKAFSEVLAAFENDYDVIRSAWNMPVERMPQPSFSQNMSFLESTVPLYISTRQEEHRHRASLELLQAAIDHLRDPQTILPNSNMGNGQLQLRREEDKLIFVSPIAHEGSSVALEIRGSSERVSQSEPRQP